MVRGKDVFAIKAIQYYISMTLDVVSTEMTAELISHRERIRRYQRDKPELRRFPD